MENGKAAEIILVRHGETQWNIEGRWQGHFDSPLTENGIRQAKSLARRLCAMNFTELYSSDLGRALRTANIIAKATGHEIITDKCLRERNVGILQGMTTQEMIEQFPKEFDEYQIQKAEYVIPKGESANQRSVINIGFLNRIAQNHRGECAVVVTHGGVLNNMIKYVLKIPPEAKRTYKIFNAAINTFIYNENGWTLHTWGDISHYNQAGILDEVQV